MRVSKREILEAWRIGNLSKIQKKCVIGSYTSWNRDVNLPSLQGQTAHAKKKALELTSTLEQKIWLQMEQRNQPTAFLGVAKSRFFLPPTTRSLGRLRGRR